MQIVHLLIKVTMEKLAAALRAYSIARGRKKQKFIQHNKDMNLKIWLGLLCLGIQQWRSIILQ